MLQKHGWKLELFLWGFVLLIGEHILSLKDNCLLICVHDSLISQVNSNLFKSSAKTNCMEKKETILLQSGGKLHIVATFDEVITSVSFSGDFAFSPSEAQGHLEQLLSYQPLDKELLTYMI